MKNPLDDSLCRQTVTVYRKQGQQILRREFHKCCFSWEDRVTDDTTGSRQERKFLLIVPCKSQCIFPNDRIYFGVGPEVSASEWDQFIPAKNPLLAIAAYAAVQYWEGQICHVEAGR